MLLVIKSGPETIEGRRAVKLARDMAADIVLMQNAVYYAEKDRLEGFCGTAYVLKDDAILRGVDNIKKGIKIIEYQELIDLMAEEKTIGAF